MFTIIFWQKKWQKSGNGEKLDMDMKMAMHEICQWHPYLVPLRYPFDTQNGRPENNI